ncbi:PREDICTED: BAG family molecular chaperone regulator 8, chloroplastic [Nicotiana attenuata]|uniref:Bag family molecular chaperone regulator 8, chloroplastic n=1 Tax=Nicotiana attenuata TaxID=49451 RepID=A0A314KUS6_NICAT|nr:PREDICTED: BAG family molecular chaperone regulator 8, chloroplastic [Nicotiana attenuata]OIT33022.1 bag family molecular chaperone regulator 8, chloroplastic [Nicotiana attenuata]
MASHHHYHHHPTVAATNPSPISAVCYCYSCYPTPSPYHSPYPHPPPPPNLHSTTPYTHYPPPPPYNPPNQCQCVQPPHQNHHYFEEVNQQVNKVQDQQTQRTITSLLRRIAALESSLRRSSSRSPRSRQSLRDAAARTIQTHFRAFLARRSRTLRQLKQLASIKTTFNNLKSSVSRKPHFDTQAVSHRAMDLLVKLDSIQGDDQLIRDGKRSINNELTRFMKVINGVSVFSSRVVKNVRSGNKSRVLNSDREVELGTNLNKAIDKFVATVNESEEEEEEEEEHLKNPRVSEARKSEVLRRNRDEGGLKPKQKKSVSFAENVNGQESFDADEIELMKNLSRRVEKIGNLSKDDAEVDEEEDGGQYSGSSDNEYISRKNDGHNERNVRDEDENENETESFLFSAPLPVKMEARAAADYINNRKKGVKIVDN